MRFLSYSLLAFLSTWSLIRCIHAAPAAKVDFFRYPATITHMPKTGDTTDHSAIRLTDAEQKGWNCDESIRAKLIQRGFEVGHEVTFLKRPGTSEDTAYDVQSLLGLGTVVTVDKAKSVVVLQDLETSEQLQCEGWKAVAALKPKVGMHLGFKRRGTASGKDKAYEVFKPVQ